MARTKALYDPRQRLAQQAQYANTPAAGETVGQSAANQLSSREKGLQAIQAARQQMTPVKAPAAPTQPGTPTGKPVVTQPTAQGQPQIAPKNPLANLATVADQMKAAREKGDLGTLADLTTKQYLPQLESVQSTIGNVNTGQVGRILGEATANLPTDLNAQRTELSKLAQQLQTARETGDLGTAAILAQRYQALVTAMQGQVTGSAKNPTQVVPKAQTVDEAVGQLSDSTKQIYKNQYEQQVQKWNAAGQQPLMTFDQFLRSQVEQSMNSQAVMELGTSSPGALTKGGVPTSTLPEGGSGIVPPAGSGETAGQVPAQVQAQYDRIDQAVATIDEQIKKLREQQFRTGPNNPAAAGIASQIAALERQKAGLAQERKGAMDQWESTGKYEAQLDELIKTPRPGSQYTINDLPENLKNEAVQEALAAVKAGQDPQAALDKYLAYFDQNVDFSLKPPGITAPDRTVEGMTKTGGIEIAGPDNVDLSTDKSRIDAALQRSGMTPEGQQALKLQLETIQKRLSEGGGGFSEQELNDMAAPILAANNRAMQADISAMQHDLAASGFESGPILAQKTAEIRQQYAEKNQAAITELVRENMGYKQQGTSEAIAALGGIAESERTGALSEKELALRGATTQTELTSQEKQAQVEAEYRQKALFQEGRLTQQGQLIQQELESYGLNLQKYQTDKGFDEAALDRDLKERLAEQEGSMAAAELKFKQIKEAMDQAGKEVERDDARDSLIAELTVRVAQGDQDAKYQMEALNVEKDYRQQGLDNNWAEFLGNLQYQIMSNREENQLKWKMLLTRIDAEIKSQGGGGLTGFLAEVAGIAVGAATGGLGTAAGGYLAGKVFGGK